MLKDHPADPRSRGLHGAPPATAMPRALIAPRAFRRGPEDRPAWLPPAGEGVPGYIWVALLSAALQIAVSGNLLFVFGIAYANEGGNPLVKFHPGTYLSVVAFLMMLLREPHPVRSVGNMVLQYPPAALYFVMIGVCFAFGVYNNGTSGVAIYIETYLPSLMLFLVFANSSTYARKLLAYSIIALLCFSAAMALVEAVRKDTFIPIYVGRDKDVGDYIEDLNFRPTGLSSWPLAGAMMTMMGLLLLLGMAMKPLFKVPLLGLLLMALVAFGGRTALAITLVTLAGLGVYEFFRRARHGQLGAREGIGALLVAVAVPVAVVVLVGFTSLGDRLMNKMYLDESALTRFYQFVILRQVSIGDLMTGVPNWKIDQMAFRTSLDYPMYMLENFWLIILLNVGLFGFAVYLAGLGGFLWMLWRRVGLYGRLLILTVMLLSSTSNSIGRKTNVLTLLTACVIASSAYTGRRAAEAAQAEPVTDVMPSPRPPRLQMPAPDRAPAPARGLRPLRQSG